MNRGLAEPSMASSTETPRFPGLYASNPPRRPLPRTGGWVPRVSEEREGFSEIFSTVTPFVFF